MAQSHSPPADVSLQRAFSPTIRGAKEALNLSASRSAAVVITCCKTRSYGESIVLHAQKNRKLEHARRPPLALTIQPYHRLLNRFTILQYKSPSPTHQP